MCGRFSRSSGRDALAEEFGVARFVNVPLEPRYNIAPGQSVEAIIRDGAELRMGPMRWGFAAQAATEQRPAPINARAETVATMGLFREAFRRRRCLVVADGFYEWRTDGQRKRPHFIRLRSGRPLAFAGIWSMQREPVGTPYATCAIITCVPNELMAPIHNRMPVILPPAARDQWLDRGATEIALRALLVPFPSAEMDAYEVSTAVNWARNDSPECVRPMTRPP